MAKLSCPECQKFIYTIPDGVAETYQGVNDEPTKIPRGDVPTPCERCPKGGPENDEIYRLSWKNFRTLTLYRRVKSGVVAIPKHLESDPLLADNFAIIDEVKSDAKAESLGNQITNSLSIALMRMRHG